MYVLFYRVEIIIMYDFGDGNIVGIIISCFKFKKKKTGRI
jgi:hypothetical protein